MIYLRENKIGNEGVKALANALRANSTITTISLRNNNISDEGGMALLEMLDLNDTVTTIDLDVNKIDGNIRSSINLALADNKNAPKGLRLSKCAGCYFVISLLFRRLADSYAIASHGINRGILTSTFHSPLLT